MRHGSLFSGIGGFDLAAHWMGWENVFHCEINPFCNKILNYYFPNADAYEDIKKTDFTKYADTIDVLSGGFPCQPFSTAGKRKGSEDDRYLWDEMLRAIKEIQPSWIVGENVYGLINWNGGMVFQQVQTDLETQGYEVFSYLLAAAGVNAPHKRERIFIIAKNTNKDGWSCDKWKEQSNIGGFGDIGSRDNERICISKGTPTDPKSGRTGEFTQESGRGEDRRFDNYGEEGNATNSMCFGLQSSEEIKSDIGRINAFNDPSENVRSEYATNSNCEMREIRNCTGEGTRRTIKKERIESPYRTREWETFPTQSPICGGDDGIPTKLDGITIPRWRNESIKGYGNAVVPQLVMQLFKTIQKYEDMQSGCKSKADYK